jgi:hypothetical protein
MREIGADEETDGHHAEQNQPTHDRVLLSRARNASLQRMAPLDDASCARVWMSGSDRDGRWYQAPAVREDLNRPGDLLKAFDHAIDDVSNAFKQCTGFL